jgi:hypothetical protein
MNSADSAASWRTPRIGELVARLRLELATRLVAGLRLLSTSLLESKPKATEAEGSVRATPDAPDADVVMAVHGS